MPRQGNGRAVHKSFNPAAMPATGDGMAAANDPSTPSRFELTQMVETVRGIANPETRAHVIALVAAVADMGPVDGT